MIPCHGWLQKFPLVAHPSKIGKDQWYDSAALIAPEGANTRWIWRPHRCGHWRPGCCPRRNSLVTEAYPWSILTDGRRYQEWKAIMKVHPSSRGNSFLPLGRGYRSASEVARSAGVALTGPVVVDPLLIIILFGVSVIYPHRWVQQLLRISAFFIN